VTGWCLTNLLTGAPPGAVGTATMDAVVCTVGIVAPAERKGP